jgi:hypothetical protein
MTVGLPRIRSARLRMSAAMLACSLFVASLTACSGGKISLDPLAIDAVLTTVPSPAVAETPVGLKATVTGADSARSVRVKFDVRVDGKPKLIDGQSAEAGAFEGTFAFPQPGVYEVYIHLYIDDLHLTKKKQVEVQ